MMCGTASIGPLPPCCWVVTEGSLTLPAVLAPQLLWQLSTVHQLCTLDEFASKGIPWLHVRMQHSHPAHDAVACCVC